MRLMVSTFTDVISVLGHATIRPGDLVDFDQPVGKGTLADALGPHTAGFVEDFMVDDGRLDRASPSDLQPGTVVEPIGSAVQPISKKGRRDAAPTQE
jgi:hypothetical protein